ncbi:SCO family protein [Rhabdochromatium marinum]|uniref:SCO family protein n=1 Tax=Rhabdochromatium marinum TaxID=48729 RepID=UPI0019072DA7|nr:hypothetical protein [Rhabdochromatium marinum]MBK1647729.1 hypothetical protein [Rhabdochromatium marinum]
MLESKSHRKSLLPTLWQRRSFARRLLMALLAVGLFLIGYQWGNQVSLRQAPTASIAGVRLRPPVPLPVWQLEDEQAQPMTSDAFAGDWVLLGFAPVASLRGQLTMTRLLEVFNRLADRPDLRAQLRLVLVSAPLNAPLARDFRRLLPSAWVLTGSAEQRERLQASLVGPVPTTDALQSPDADTDVAATPVALYLIDPHNALVAIFPAVQPPAQVASDVRQLADHPSQEP